MPLRPCSSGWVARNRDLAIVFVSAEHAAHFDAVPALLQREFENVFIFGCCGGGVIGGGREIEDRPAFSLTGAVLLGVRLKGTHLDAAQVPPVYAEARAWEDALRITPSQQPSFLLLADPFSFEAETFIKRFGPNLSAGAEDWRLGERRAPGRRQRVCTWAIRSTTRAASRWP